VIKRAEVLFLVYFWCLKAIHYGSAVNVHFIQGGGGGEEGGKGGVRLKSASVKLDDLCMSELNNTRFL
jgi:hypothetical protein